VSWFRVDDDFHLHWKAREAGLRALGLWVVAGSFTGTHSNDDGVVPEWFVRSWRATRDAERLEAVGLWVPHAVGWQFHDWREFNRTRDEVRAERAKSAARQAEWRARHAVSHGATHTSRNGAPTRPDPNEKGDVPVDEAGWPVDAGYFAPGSGLIRPVGDELESAEAPLEAVDDALAAARAAIKRRPKGEP
jgi:hypothetical protein